MAHHRFRDYLSYDSSLNYFLWSNEVDALKVLMSELLHDRGIASAEVNEDKHHHMLSFKTGLYCQAL